MGAGASAQESAFAEQIIEAWPRVPLAARTKAHAEAESILDAAVEVSYDVTVTPPTARTTAKDGREPRHQRPLRHFES